MENKVKKEIIKKIELYSTILMLATTPIVFTGCSVSETPQTIEIETNGKIDEVVSSNEVSSNTISSNTISDNGVSSNTVSENRIIENTEIKELSPLVPPTHKITLGYFNSLTDEEKVIYQLGYSSFLDSEKPENGIYETNFDISQYGDEYAKYKEYKNGDKTFMLIYNVGYTSAIKNNLFANGDTYVSITIDGDGWYGHPLKIANTNELTIIKPLDDTMNRFYIIKDYQGEEVIEANKYENFVNGNLIDVELSNFTATTVKTYFDRYENKYSMVECDDEVVDYWPRFFNETDLLNTSKSK